MKFFLFLSFFLFSVSLVSQPFEVDEYTHYQDLSFYSDLEREAFEAYFSGDETKLLDIFILAGSKISKPELEKQKGYYTEILEKVRKKRFSKKKPKKQIQLLHEVVTDELYNYQTRNEFKTLFENGFFNCVSSSALYGLLLQDEGVPFVVQEKPNHVYLRVYPKKQDIVLEATNPYKDAYTQFDYKAKKTAVEELIRFKLVTSEQVRKKGMEKVFTDYFLTDKSITLAELAGIQYLNLAVYALEDQEYEKALLYADKARCFYRNEQSKNTLLIALISNIDNDDLLFEDRLPFLNRLAPFYEDGVTKENVLYEVELLRRKYLEEEKNDLAFNNRVQTLNTIFTDPELKKEVNFVRYTTLARFKFQEGRFSGIDTLLSNTYELDTSNTETLDLLVYWLSWKLENKMELSDGEELIISFQNNYPGLLHNNYFIAIKMNVWLAKAANFFDNGNLREASRYLQYFEKFFTNIEEYPINRDILEYTYSLGASAYYRAKMRTMAIDVLERGLKYIPTSRDLNNKLAMIRRY